MSSTPTSDRRILIAEYTLGLLSLQETSQAQALLGADSQAAVAALKWENSFLELVDLLPPVEPGPQSLQRLQAALGHAPAPIVHYSPPPVNAEKAPPAPPPAPETPTPDYETLTVAAALRTREKAVESPRDEPPAAVAAAAAPPRIKVSTAQPSVQMPPPPTAIIRKGNIWFWRIASLIFALIALTLALMPAKPVAPPVTIVQIAPTRAAIMQAPGQSSTPGWVVTIDPQGNVLMRPQVRSDIPADASVQLWTRNKNMPQSRSLGLIDPNQPVTVPAALMGEISPDQIFEMTQEPAGGSPTASPSGPILFIGRIVTFGQPMAAPPTSTPGADQ